MRFFAAVDALPSLESMKFPVFSLLAGNFGLFRDEFAADSPLQRRVRCEPVSPLEFAFLRREVAIFRGCGSRGKRRGRQRRAGRGNIGLTGGNISVGPYSSTAPPLIWAA